MVNRDDVVEVVESLVAGVTTNVTVPLTSLPAHNEQGLKDEKLRLKRITGALAELLREYNVSEGDARHSAEEIIVDACTRASNSIRNQRMRTNPNVLGLGEFSVTGFSAIVPNDQLEHMLNQSAASPTLTGNSSGQPSAGLFGSNKTKRRFVPINGMLEGYYLCSIIDFDETPAEEIGV